MIIGAIADDVTGGTDVAVAFRRQGLRTALFFGVPPQAADLAETDAVVVALKTRTVPAATAVDEALSAARWLRENGAPQLYFKYCSTFDSTPAGNIGPVLDSLTDLVGAGRVVQTPSSPEHGRTQYSGTLFVHGVLLQESPMRNHPLTPMRDSYLPRLMDQQARHTSAIIPLTAISEGTEAVSNVIRKLNRDAHYLFADAITDSDLLTVARSIKRDALIAGGAGLAGALGAAHVEELAPSSSRTLSPGLSSDARSAVLAGSCSHRTLEQVGQMLSQGRPAHRLDALQTPDATALADQALQWVDALPSDAPAPMVYSSLPPTQLHKVQEALGVQESADILESAIGQVAAGLAARGFTRFVAAGGETSGAIVASLGIQGGIVGSEAARGVPWIHTTNGMDVLLKSGNFGEPDLLVRASEASAA